MLEETRYKSFSFEIKQTGSITQSLCDLGHIPKVLCVPVSPKEMVATVFSVMPTVVGLGLRACVPFVLLAQREGCREKPAQ